MSKCQSSPHFDTVKVSKCQSFGHAGAPLCQILQKKVVARVNVYVAGPPCVKFSKKRSLLVSMFLDRRCVSRSRPAVGPLCVKLSKKRSSSVSNFGAPRGPCQSSGRAGGPVSNSAPLCQSVKFQPAPGALLSQNRHPGSCGSYYTPTATQVAQPESIVRFTTRRVGRQ